MQYNSALHALLAFQYLLIGNIRIDSRPHLDYSTTAWITTLFHLRTITSPDLLGEPALEGVHSDGVDHTMTTMLDIRNATSDSAVTYVHDMEQPNAVTWDAADPKYVRGALQHRDRFDTLLVIDHERKHSLSPVYAADPVRLASRDMLIFFTRKPALPGHVSYPYDSRQAHHSRPLTFDLPERTVLEHETA